MVPIFFHGFPSSVGACRNRLIRSAFDYVKPQVQQDVREVKHSAQGFVTYAIYVTLGAGLLFPWNAFITAADYFELEFPVCRVGVIEFLVCVAQL